MTLIGFSQILYFIVCLQFNIGTEPEDTRYIRQIGHGLTIIMNLDMQFE